MKLLKRGILITGICVLAAVLAARPLALWAAKKQLRAVFTNAYVSIAGCRIDPFSHISFQGIRVAHERVFECTIDEARIDFGPRLLTRLTVEEVSLRGVSVIVAQAGKSLMKLADEVRLSPGKGVFGVQSLRLVDFHCSIKSKELNYGGDFSLLADIPSQKIVSLSAVISELDGFGVRLENASIVIPAVQAGGQNLAASLVKVGKVGFTEIKGALAQEAGSLSIDPLSARLFGGRMQAAVSLRLESGYPFEAAVEVFDLDLEKMIRQLELGEKVELSGLLTGRIAVSGSQRGLQALSGDLSSSLAGGVVRIKDAQVLKGAAGGIAGQSGSRVTGSIDPLDIVVENLKDYHYNTGSVKLGLEGKNIVVYTYLDSQAHGKRDFAIVLHQAR